VNGGGPANLTDSTEGLRQSHLDGSETWISGPRAGEPIKIRPNAGWQEGAQPERPKENGKESTK